MCTSVLHTSWQAYFNNCIYCLSENSIASNQTRVSLAGLPRMRPRGEWRERMNAWGILKKNRMLENMLRKLVGTQGIAKTAAGEQTVFARRLKSGCDNRHAITGAQY